MLIRTYVEGRKIIQVFKCDDCGHEQDNDIVCEHCQHMTREVHLTDDTPSPRFRYERA